MTNEYLAHHGVKGMKWGVRKAETEPVASAAAAGGGGGVELDEETQELLKAVSEGKIEWETLSVAQQNKIRDFLGRSNENAKTVLGDAANAVGDYIQHLPSDGPFQFTRKDKTGLMNTKEEAERYKQNEKSKADVRAFAEQNIRRKKESEAAGEAAAQKYRSTPGSLHTEIRDLGTHEAANVYRNDSHGKPKLVGSRLRDKKTGAASYSNDKPFGIGTDPKEIDLMINSGARQEEYARKRGRAQYDKQWTKHDGFYGDTVYLAHHGVKGMKWGVRRSPSQLGHDKVVKMAKRQAKADAYRSKADSMVEKHNASVHDANKQLKRAKYVRKLGKYERKAGKHAFTDIGVWRRENAARKANRMRGKIHAIDYGSDRFTAKVNKLNAKANRLELRNKRVGKRMSKKLKGVKIKDLTAEQKAVGRKYIDSIFE